MTYGALGTTRERTLEIAARIRRDFGRNVAHHLTCVGATRDEISRILDEIADTGIENIVALRGDPPLGQTEFRPVEGGFRHASELVAHIRSRGGFGIAGRAAASTIARFSPRSTSSNQRRCCGQ